MHLGQGIHLVGASYEKGEAERQTIRLDRLGHIAPVIAGNHNLGRSNQPLAGATPGAPDLAETAHGWSAAVCNRQKNWFDRAIENWEKTFRAPGRPSARR